MNTKQYRITLQDEILRLEKQLEIAFEKDDSQLIDTLHRQLFKTKHQLLALNQPRRKK